MKKISLYYKDSFSYEESHELLIRVASLNYSLPTDSFQLISERGKKPYFSNYPSIHFSISHSGNIWVCAFTEDEVGVDVQLIDRTRSWDKLAGRFFSQSEAEAVKCSDNKAETFSGIWSRKEAVVKLFGVGIDSRFTSFSALDDVVNFSDKDVFIRDFCLNIPQYHSAALAYPNEFEIQIHKLT